MPSDEIIETMARAFDREEAAQMGEPSLWEVYKDELDPEWISNRIACATAALSAADAAGWVMVPVHLVKQAFRDGLDYGNNVTVVDADLAWQQSRIRAMIGGRP